MVSTQRKRQAKEASDEAYEDMIKNACKSEEETKKLVETMSEFEDDELKLTVDAVEADFENVIGSHGYKIIEKLIDLCDEDLLKQICQCFRNNVFKYAAQENASNVLRQVFVKVSCPEERSSMARELEGKLADCIDHPTRLLFVKLCIKHLDHTDKKELVEELLLMLNTLIEKDSTRPFVNFVVKHCGFGRERIYNALKPNLKNLLNVRGYVMVVMEIVKVCQRRQRDLIPVVAELATSLSKSRTEFVKTCIDYADTNEHSLFISNLFDKEEVLYGVATNSIAWSVLAQLYQKADNNNKGIIRSRLETVHQRLMLNNFGRKVLSSCGFK